MLVCRLFTFFWSSPDLQIFRVKATETSQNGLGEKKLYHEESPDNAHNVLRVAASKDFLKELFFLLALGFVILGDQNIKIMRHSSP